MGLADFIKLGSMGFKPSEIKGFKEQGIPTEQVVKLAENGYSVAEINELITLSGTDEQLQPGNGEQTPSAGPQVTPDNEGAKAEQQYKEQLEEMQKAKDELEKKLAAAQQANSSRNLASAANMKTPREQVQEAFRGLY